MSIATLILGQSGTGKSTSLRNLNPNDVLLIQVVKKPLPFRSAEWKYLSKDGGSIYVTDSPEVIIKRMQQTSKPIIIIDEKKY
ncbi:ATP-binding protein [Acinetobacter baumannii]